MFKRIYLLFFFFSPILNLLAQSQPGSGHSLEFNGFSSYINCGYGSRSITNQVTTEAWIKTSSYSYQWIIGKYVNAEDRGFHLFIQNGKPAFAGRAGKGSYFNSGYGTTTISDGKWHHLAGVFTGNKWEIWVDGQLENSTSFSMSNPSLINSAPLTIGNYFMQTENYFSGEIDEVRIWNKVRSGQEIKDDMCRKLIPSSPGLVGYFKLDEGTGIITADLSSFNNQGNLINLNSASWRTSGAPIGDISTHLYTASFTNKKLKLAGTNLDTLSLVNFTGNPTGVHIFRVNSIPNTTNGINPAPSANSYFGVFTRGTNTGYSIQYKPANILCNSDSMALYKRADNSNTWWNASVINLNSSKPYFEKTGENYRSEYIFFSQKSLKNVKITGNLEICPGSSTTLTASGANNFSWSTGHTTSSISVSTPGKYVVMAINALGCITKDSVFVKEKLLTGSNAGPDLTICHNEKMMIGTVPTSGYTYSWSPATGLSNATIANPTVTLSNQTNAPFFQTYILTTTFNGCTTTDEVVVKVNPADRICNKTELVIYNIVTDNNDRKNDYFTVENINLYPGNELTLYNRWGIEIYRKKDYMNDWSGENCTQGTYFYLLKLKDGRSFKGWFDLVRN